MTATIHIRIPKLSGLEKRTFCGLHLTQLKSDPANLSVTFADALRPNPSLCEDCEDRVALLELAATELE